MLFRSCAKGPRCAVRNSRITVDSSSANLGCKSSGEAFAALGWCGAKQFAKPIPHPLSFFCKNGLERNGASRRLENPTDLGWVAACPDDACHKKHAHTATTVRDRLPCQPMSALSGRLSFTRIATQLSLLKKQGLDNTQIHRPYNAARRFAEFILREPSVRTVKSDGLAESCNATISRYSFRAAGPSQM